MESNEKDSHLWQGLWQSLKEFVPTLGRAWWGFFIAGVVMPVIGTILDVTGLPSLPLWMWVWLFVISVVSAAFWAFHKTRASRDAWRRKFEAEGAPSTTALDEARRHIQKLINEAPDPAAAKSERDLWVTRVCISLRQLFNRGPQEQEFLDAIGESNSKKDRIRLGVTHLEAFCSSLHRDAGFDLPPEIQMAAAQQSQQQAQTEQFRQFRQQIVDALSEFLAQSDNLTQKMESNCNPAVIQQCAAWHQDVETFLGSYLGKPYADHFNNSQGLQRLVSSIV